METIFKIFLIILFCILFLTGCKERERYVFQGTVISIERTQYKRNVVIEDDNKDRIHIDTIYAHTPGEEEFKTVIVGDVVAIEYEKNSSQNIITRFEIVEKK